MEVRGSTRSPQFATAARAEARAALRGVASTDSRLTPSSANAGRAPSQKSQGRLSIKARESLEWGPAAGRGPTRPVSPKLSKSRRRLPPSDPTHLAQTMNHRTGMVKARKLGDESVFDRLSAPRRKMDVDENRPPRPAGVDLSRYTGRTEPKEFSLSGPSRRPAQSATTSAWPGRTADSRRSLDVDLSAYKPNMRTTPQPFKLRSVELHEACTRRRMSDNLQAQRELELRRAYKATPVSEDMLKHPTFTVKHAPLEECMTVPLERFCAASDERAQKRREFDEHVEDKIRREEEQREEERRREELELAEEAKLEWKQNAFRARGVPESHYDIPKLPTPPPSLPLTDPQTPGVLSRHRQDGWKDDGNADTQRDIEMSTLETGSDPPSTAVDATAAQDDVDSYAAGAEAVAAGSGDSPAGVPASLETSFALYG